MEDTVELFRPVGKRELELIRDSGFKRFPPRFFHQPFFYPVLNQEYAEKIARDWNTKDEASGYSGYVTRFKVKTDFVSRYPVQIVGSKDIHQELWIPSEDLELFNEALVGLIEVVKEFSK